MAYKTHGFAFLAIALILFVSLVQGALPVPIPAPAPVFGGANIVGRLCCTPTGTCPGTPLPGVLVRVNCTNILGVTIFTGQTTTTATGNFNITVPNVVGLVPGILSGSCRVTVLLPLSQTVCPVLATATGLLEGIIGTIVPVVVGLLSYVLNITISAFVIVAI